MLKQTAMIGTATGCLLALLALPAAAPAQLQSGGRLVASIDAPTPRAVQAGDGSIWVANGPTRTVTRLDPRTNAVLARIPVPDPASVIGAGEGAIWVTASPATASPGSTRGATA